MGILVKTFYFVLFFTVATQLHADTTDTEKFKYSKGELAAHLFSEQDRCSDLAPEKRGAWCNLMKTTTPIYEPTGEKPQSPPVPSIRCTNLHQVHPGGLLEYYSGILSPNQIEKINSDKPTVVVIDTLEPTIELPFGYKPIAHYRSKVAIGAAHSDGGGSIDIDLNQLSASISGTSESKYDVITNSLTPHRDVALYCLSKIGNVDESVVDSALAAGGLEAQGYAQMSELMKRQNVLSNGTTPIAFGIRGLHQSDNMAYATVNGKNISDPDYPIWTNMLVFIKEDSEQEAYDVLNWVVENTDLGEPILDSN